MISARNAAILVIGNEVLTGKVADQNIAPLARLFFELGVALERVVICEDRVEVIASDLNALRAAHDVVITTGGVGPTHDDLTYEAVAHAFGVPLVREAGIEAMIRARFGERTHAGHLRMADIPEGSELVRSSEMPWPVIRKGNVFVLPGVPEIVQLKLPLLRAHISSPAKLVSRALRLTVGEFDIAERLAVVQRAHPQVRIGSYPQWNDAECKVKLTFDGPTDTLVGAAVDAFLAVAPAGAVLAE